MTGPVQQQRTVQPPGHSTQSTTQLDKVLADISKHFSSYLAGIKCTGIMCSRQSQQPVQSCGMLEMLTAASRPVHALINVQLFTSQFSGLQGG